MIRSKESFTGRVVLRLGGTFDAAAEWELHAILEDVTFDTQVTVDFRQVLDFHDVAVAMLARDVGNATGRVSLLGLCQHQLRILRHCGIGNPWRLESSQGTTPAPGR